MTLQTWAHQPRRTLSLPFGGAKPHKHGSSRPCAAPLTRRELRDLVADMID